MNYRHGKTAQLRAFCLLLLWSLLLLLGGTSLANAASVTFTTNTTIDTNTLTWEGYDVIVHGCTVTINGAHSFQSLTVESNGIVTHAQGLVGGMNLTIAGNVTVDNGSGINVNSRGYGSEQGPGHGFSDYTGSYGGGGASYGGEGRGSSSANAGAAYGSILNPTDLGSGGGTGYTGQYGGQPGGGAVILKAGGTLLVNGYISSSGSGPNNGGGGSGGSINLTVGTLAGAGSITAYGGSNSNSSSSSGGGGRIAIAYTANTYTGGLSAAGGRDYNGWCGAGTILQKGPGQTLGDLLVDNSSNIGGGTPIVGAQTFDNVRVRSAGILVPVYQQTMNLTVLNNCVVEIGGYISADGRGYGGTQGPGAGGSDPNSSGGAGGSYGGNGRNTNVAAGPVYGDIRNPTDFGSGGGNSNNGIYKGNVGGGAIRLTVNGTLQVDGILSSNGTGGNYEGGGGSGGSLYLAVGTLSGKGIIAADGGSGYYAASGGGGRIALYYNQDLFTGMGTMRAAGNNGSSGYAAAGTIFRQQAGQTLGDLWITSSYGNVGLPTVLNDAQTFDNVVVFTKGVLSPPVQTTLRLTTLGNFTIMIGGYVTADGRGYDGTRGPGAGGSDANNSGGGAGGSYGGKGHNANGPVSGPTYGSESLPTDFGSGGGNGYLNTYGGGSGGGAIRLTVNGTLQVDGFLSSNGTNGNNSGGGAGGSILARAGMIAGVGSITAYGGYGNNSGAPGGGGRIALYYVKSTFTNVSASGSGGGYGQSSNGTVHQEVTTGNLTVTLSLSTPVLSSGQIAYLGVNLSGPTPAGGIDVQLSSSNTLAVIVPLTVTVPEGQTSVVVPITANVVTQAQTTTLQAQLWDQFSAQTLTVKPLLGTLSLNPSSANGNSTVTGTLTLNTPAPAGGLSIALTSSNPNVSVPAQIAFAGGTTTRTFSVTVGTIATAETATISAVYGPEKLNSTLFVNPSGITLLALSVAPASVIGGNSSVGVVVLSKAAPAGGVTVALASGDATIGVPASVTVPAGKTSASFPISTQIVAAPKSAIISAALGATKMATLNVRMPGVGSLILIPTNVSGGDTSIGIVTLEAPSAAPVVVTITSSKTQAVPDAVIVIAAGDTTGTFSIATSAVSSTTTATITAKGNNIAKSQALVISP